MSIKARKEVISIGHLKLDGYILDTGVFGMSQTQVILISGVTNEASQASKRYIQISQSKMAQTLAPQGLTVHQKVTVENQSEKINLVELDSVAPFLTSRT